MDEINEIKSLGAFTINYRKGKQLMPKNGLMMNTVLLNIKHFTINSMLYIKNKF